MIELTNQEILAALRKAGALPGGRPKTEYSAAFCLLADQTRLEGRLYYANGKERREQETLGVSSVVLFDSETNTIRALIPITKGYIEVCGDDSAREAPQAGQSNVEDVGVDTVNGVATRKQKITGSDGRGSDFSGHVWITDDQIVMKVAMDVTGPAGTTTAIELVLSNLQRGPQDPSLFEIPSDYSKVSIPNIGGAAGILETK